ncbi:MAG: hypothetical protein ACI311_01550 [Bacilli bacterium]
MRKNLFGIQKKTNIIDGVDFIIREAGKDSQDKIEKARDNVNDIGSNAEASSINKALYVIFILIGLSNIIYFFNLLENKETETNPYIKFIYLGVSIIAFGLCFLIDLLTKKRAKKILDSEQFNKSVEYYNKQIDEIKNELSIPLNANDVDVFSELYVEKNGKRKMRLAFGSYAIVKLVLFIDDNKLCLSDCYSIYAIPLSSIKSIDKINKHVSFIGWTKEVPFNDESLKEYHIKQNGYGIYYIKTYYSIKIDDELGEFEILVPNYEINNFLKYINIAISEN